MAKAPRLGVNPIKRPTKYEPYNDPTLLTAKSQETVKAFNDLLRRSREAGGHDDEALKNDRPVLHLKRGQI
jgi:hypothetical protein